MPINVNGDTDAHKKQGAGVRDNLEKLSGSKQSPVLITDLYELSGKEVLDHLLDRERPGELVQALSDEDFFWIIKKVGEDDCLPLLQLASTDQWEFLLDLEVWEKDQLDLDITSGWLKRLQEADCGRLVKWLFKKGESLAYFYAFKSLDVAVVSDKDEVYDLPDGFFSLDGVIHIRARSPEYRESLENILRTMATTDFDRYQALLLGLVGVLPAEMEEEMYRLRNVRLAEHGFLPREEALSVYAPLAPEALSLEGGRIPSDQLIDGETRALVPVLPLTHAGDRNLLMEAISEISDPILLDRIRLEFAGLCNQLLSADGLLVRELDILLKVCRKASGYLSLALERLCGRNFSKAQETVRNHTLLSLFRVGFGLSLKLKWEAERWVDGSWFLARGLDRGFWGEEWGGVLTGLTQKKPLVYTGLRKGDEFKEFETLSEIRDCTLVLRHLMVLDGLFERLSGSHPMDDKLFKAPEFHYRPFLFNFWSRLLLGLKPSFAGVSLEQAKEFFQKIRGEKGTPPYGISRFKEAFITDFKAFASDSAMDAVSILEETLSLIWEEFEAEYARVSIEDLDGRYSRFVTIL